MKPVYEFQPFFHDVQMSRVLKDGKTFVDCIPRISTDEIARIYESRKHHPQFDIHEFVLEFFDLPDEQNTPAFTNSAPTIYSHIDKLWDVLTRSPDQRGGTLLPLPFPYIVPGGRFREIYYWDSYFTMLGLKQSGRVKMIENMIRNFSFLISQFGYIPNGNRKYYTGRSQPPFFSLMVRLLSGQNDNSLQDEFLPVIETEYQFWMRDSKKISNDLPALRRVVRLSDGEILNRYWDENDTPRPESYFEDVELKNACDRLPQVIYRHIRAAAESGWDFSCRWFGNEHDFSSIHTTDIIPVDLNCLLYHSENLLAEIYLRRNENEKSNMYISLAGQRKQAILKYCWNKNAGFFTDYDWQAGCQKNILSLAGVFPLFFQLADQTQATAVARVLEDRFLQKGGLLTTLNFTGQQWDAPNGWAPLQWMAIAGLHHYGNKNLSREIALRWMQLNEDVYSRTGKLMEKYNVIDTNLEAGGGEYPGQDGFGWTNGVYLEMNSFLTGSASHK